jgi:15-cis-phytoene synthase
MLSGIRAAAGPAISLDAAFEQTDAVTRWHSRTFYLATALLPRRARRAIRALYAFCRATDDLVDNDGATLEAVERWRAEAALPASAQRRPDLLAWAHIRQQYGVDGRHQEELIDGIALDLIRRRYNTWPELERYCYLVASTVGLLSMPILGLAPNARFDQAAPYAIRLGIALQLTNILRDVGEDAVRGRVYLPATDLAAFGLSPDDILDGVHDSRFEALMQFEIARARALYRAALPGIALLSPVARPAVGAAALLYQAILGRIEAIGYRVHSDRARTSGLRKILMLPGILYRVWTIKPPLLAPEPPPAAACLDSG